MLTRSLLWPPAHQMVPVTLSVQATDTCGPTTFKIVRITSNESFGHRQQGLDWLVTGDLTVDLKAERLGAAQGRIYTIVFECVDAAGNSSSSSVIVKVPHDNGQAAVEQK